MRIVYIPPLPFQAGLEETARQPRKRIPRPRRSMNARTFHRTQGRSPELQDGTEKGAPRVYRSGDPGLRRRHGSIDVLQRLRREANTDDPVECTNPVGRHLGLTHIMGTTCPHMMCAEHVLNEMTSLCGVGSERLSIPCPWKYLMFVSLGKVGDPLLFPRIPTGGLSALHDPGGLGGSLSIQKQWGIPGEPPPSAGIPPAR